MLQQNKISDKKKLKLMEEQIAVLQHNYQKDIKSFEEQVAILQQNEVSYKTKTKFMGEQIAVLQQNEVSYKKKIDALDEKVASLQQEFPVAKYTELELADNIGTGGYGTVYKGKWLGNIVAVKKFHSMTPKMMSVFQHEVKILNKLRHPNIVLFLGATIPPDECCVIMEYVPSGSLYTLIHEQDIKLKPSQIVRIAKDICAGLC